MKVKEVNLIEVDQENLNEEVGFVAKCKWNVRGSVGHWGHIHQRTNQPEARSAVEPVDGDRASSDRYPPSRLAHQPDAKQNSRPAFTQRQSLLIGSYVLTAVH